MAILEAPKAEENVENYIRMRAAAEQLGVKIQGLAYYVAQYNLKKVKFPLDRNAYILMSDFEMIKTHREAREKRRVNG